MKPSGTSLKHLLKNPRRKTSSGVSFSCSSLFFPFRLESFPTSSRKYRSASPSNMSDHIPVIRIRPMPVEIPIRRSEVHLHIPDNTPSLLPDLENGIAEVRPGLEIPFPGTHHANLATATRRQILRPQGRVVPDRLDMPLGDRLHAAFFTSSMIRPATSGFAFRYSIAASEPCAICVSP